LAAESSPKYELEEKKMKKATRGIFMMEPTVTESNALYFVQHKTAKEHVPLLRRLGLGNRWGHSEIRIEPSDILFLWPRRAQRR